MRNRVLIIACGALAHELVRVQKLNRWEFLDIQCLPAEWHNTPEKIVPEVRRKIHDARATYGDNIFIGYADCGTGGLLDKLLADEKIKRLPGAHCYAFFAGEKRFAEIAQAEIGTFYLTDYLARNFDRLIIQGFRLDHRPEMKQMIFGNYKKLVYLAQLNDPQTDHQAQQAAAYLNLTYQRIYTGDTPFTQALAQNLPLQKTHARVPAPAPTPN